MSRDALAVDARAVVGDLDDDAARAVQRRDAHDAFFGLAGREALLRGFQAVVDGVADHVGQRIGEALDDGLVDLGAFALGDEPDLLAGHVGDLADQTRHALEHRLHRLRADRHDAVLDLAGQLLELVEADGDVRGLAQDRPR